MQNLDALLEIAKSIDDSHATEKANAIQLTTEMGTAIEGIGDEPILWKPSFLKLVQGTSDRTSIPKGATIGDFVIGEKKIEQPLKFIPIRTWESRQFWDPDQNNNKTLCRSPDGITGAYGQECRKCEHQKWNEAENKPGPCNKSYSMLAITADLSTVFIVNFSKSNYKIGLELKALMMKAAVAPYLRVYELSSATNSTAKNVENFRIAALAEKDRKTPEFAQPFLKHIYDAAGSDRKQSLEEFYINAKERKNDPEALAHASPLLQLGVSQGANGATDTNATMITVVEDAVPVTGMKYKV